MKTVNLPNLNETVLSALDFFIKNSPPKLNISRTGISLVVGSGNAYNTAQIIFSGRPAIIANESNFSRIIKNYQPLIKNKSIKEAIIISASGEKDSVWETKLAKKFGLKTTLLTCSAESSAAQLADKVITYRKLAEPYTYNVSTYLGMILGVTGEKAKDIKQAIKKIKLPKNFTSYPAYAFVLSDETGSVAPMLEIKRHELFGAHLSIRAFSSGEARHAKFVNAWEKELVISIGQNKYFGRPAQRLNLNLSSARAGLVMAVSYYLIGLIQSAKTPYYKKNIEAFCQTGPMAYGETKPFSIMVPGN